MAFDNRDLATQHAELLPEREALLVEDTLAAVGASVGDVGNGNALLNDVDVASGSDVLNDVADVSVS